MAAITDQVRWRRVLNHVAADLKILASIAAGEKITVEQATHASLKGDVYKPSPAIADLDAIEDVIREHKENLNCAAGGNTLTFTTVTVGKLWVVTNVLAYADPGTPTYIKIETWRVADIVPVRRGYNPGANGEVIFNGILVIDAGDILKVYFSGMAAGNDIFADIMGYQVDKY